MGLGGVISHLLSLGAKLLPLINEFAQAPSSSTSPPVESQQIEAELKQLMKMLEQIKATLYDAEGRSIEDCSVKLWLKELQENAYAAQDVLDEYHYEVLRSQAEARHASQPDSRKRKQITLPDGMYDQIKQIKDLFVEIEKNCITFRLSDEDGPKRCNSEMQIAPTSHFVVESDIIGRENEKEELVRMLSSECHDSNVVLVAAIIGTGGLGKTTLAQLAYNNEGVKQKFDIFGWVCVSEDFNVERLTKEAIESITGNTCGLTNLSALHNKINQEIKGKRVFLVLDDVWNENRSHWELFRGPFMSAKKAIILVTTRNESVANIMQAVSTLNLGYMPNEQCWQLFQHYAFGEMNQNEDSPFVQIGKQILEKCGKLPLAIKSIASLLRLEVEEKGWREVLESELWESGAGNEIFPPLQISYARLPTNLKPCFLYCSMFPKNYTFSVRELVPLWDSHGYIESNGKKSKEKIGQEYAKHLRQRSLFEVVYNERMFKLHDMVHDLARSKSENRCYSIEMGNDLNPSQNPYHLYVAGGEKVINDLHKMDVAALRTLIFKERYYKEDAFYYFDISNAHKLRALELKQYPHSTCELVFSNGNLKHLRYLSLKNWPLPEYLCSLYLLRSLTLISCDFEELPESIGNLVSLEELVIDGCQMLKKLPTEMGSLTNIQALKIHGTSVSSLPPSLNKIKGKLQVRLKCEMIGWLKDFSDLKGTLILQKLEKMVHLADAKCVNLASLHNLECLTLIWDDFVFYFDFCGESKQLQLELSGRRNIFLYEKDHYSLMMILQSHPNLKELHICGYPCVTFPKWIGNPTTCASLEKICIDNCQNLASLSFGSLCKLKYLKIMMCYSLQLLEVDSLPQVQELDISVCHALISVRIHEIKSLVKLLISGCKNLQRIVTDVEPFVELQQPMMEVEPSVERTLYTRTSSYQSYLSELNNLISLRKLHIQFCPKLRALIKEPRPVKSCEVVIIDCPGMKDWCFHHNILYEVVSALVVSLYNLLK